MQYLSPPNSPTAELEEDGDASTEDGAPARGRKLTEAQEHYSKQHADWLPQQLVGDTPIVVSPSATALSAAPTTAAARKSRFGLRVPASPAFVAGGSLHSTSTQNKAVLLPPTLSASPASTSCTAASSSAGGGSTSLSCAAASSRGSATSHAAGAAAAAGLGAAGGLQGSGHGSSWPPSTPLNIDSRTVLKTAAAAAKTRVLSGAGGLSSTGSVKTLENSATSAAAGALVAAAFERGAAVTGTTPQSAKFAAAAAAAEAAARAAAAGTKKGLPPNALVDGLPVQKFSHLRVMKEGTCVEVFCLPLLFQQARSTGRLILGRAEAADIPTEHPSCSRLHCELRRVPVADTEASTDSTSPSGAAANSSDRRRFTYTLKDLGSGHGTLINGGRVAAGKDTALEDEDEIQLGFSQRLYLFFTGKDTLEPDLPSTTTNAPQLKTLTPPPRRGPTHPQGHRPPIPASTPPQSVPVPPRSRPPPMPPSRSPCDEAAGTHQQHHEGPGAAAGAAGDSLSSWRWPREVKQGTDARWRAYQQHMEQLHQRRVATLGNRMPYGIPPGTVAEPEQAMLLQQQHHQAMYQQQLQQQQDAYAEDVGGIDCTEMSAAADVTGGGNWGWESAQHQQQLQYWQHQQQQGLSPETGWGETGLHERSWNTTNYQEQALHPCMMEQYAQEHACWDTAAEQQQQQGAAWSPQLQQQHQQQASEDNYALQQHPHRRSGWFPLPSQQYVEGERQEELQYSEAWQQQQQQQQQGPGNWHSPEGLDSGSAGRGGRDGRGGASGGGSGVMPFKRRTSTVAARKLLWQHAGKKQQEDETSAGADDGAAADGNGVKRLRLDGAKVALWGRQRGGGAQTAVAGGTREHSGEAAAAEGREGVETKGGSAKLAAAAASNLRSGTTLQASESHGSHQSPSSKPGAAATARQESSACTHSDSIENTDATKEETTIPRAFCAHILLSFVRRLDIEPWQGSSSSNRSGNGVLLGRGGRVVTRSRSDALSSLKSVKDITAEDPTQFGEFAAEMSDCPSSKKRGVLGWVHSGQPGGRPLLQQQHQQQQTQNTSGGSSKERDQGNSPQRRTATDIAAGQSVDAAPESSSASKSGEPAKQEEWWLPKEAVEAAMQLQVGQLSEVIESEHGAHLLLRLK